MRVQQESYGVQQETSYAQSKNIHLKAVSYLHFHYFLLSRSGSLTMEVASTASSFALNKPIMALPSSSRTVTPIRAMSSSTSSVRTSLSTNFIAPRSLISSASSHFSGYKLRPSSLNPASFGGSNAKRGVITMVPFYHLSSSAIHIRVCDVGFELDKRLSIWCEYCNNLDSDLAWILTVCLCVLWYFRVWIYRFKGLVSNQRMRS